jgi:hypothetical protein
MTLADAGGEVRSLRLEAPLVPPQDFTEELCCSDCVPVVLSSVPLFSSGRVPNRPQGLQPATTLPLQPQYFKKSSPRIRFLIRLWMLTKG